MDKKEFSTCCNAETYVAAAYYNNTMTDINGKPIPLIKICTKCGEIIHPKRLEILPNTKVCVKCSNVNPYKAITTINGEKDHTWNDLQVITPDSKSNEKESLDPSNLG